MFSRKLLLVRNHISRMISTEVVTPFNYIEGSRCASVDNSETMTVLNPAKGAQLCEIPLSSKADVNAAVASAKAAFVEWSKVSAFERGKLLIKAAQRIKELHEEIARLEVLDTGKPIWEARNDIITVTDCLEYFGGVAASIAGQHVSLSNGNFAMVVREPLGVIGGVGAWNYPMQTCCWKVAPALAAGNTFVYKPSQFTPVTAVTLAEVFTDVGIPPGVFNVVQGNGGTGAILCDHPDVAKLSFTGSVSTGIKIMSAAARGIKYCTLELGGKSPLIIFDDAQIENAVKGALVANFLSQGQVCSNGTRVFVHRKVYDDFVNRLVNATKKLKVGEPFDETVTVGATITPEHAQKVLAYIEGAKKEGATVLCGGDRVLLDEPYSKGWYLSPCVLTDCSDNMTVVKEEVFGSVLSLLVFDTEEEVIKRANETPYGLAGAVFTSDLTRAHRVSSKIQAGVVWINNFNITPLEVPFGGYKGSGVGRENGSETLNLYSQTKTVYVEMGDVDAGNLYPST